MDELMKVLVGLGISLNAVYLLLICGVIEVAKKFGFNSKESWPFLVIDGALSILMGVITSLSAGVFPVIVSSITYFVVSTLFYDYIMTPIRAFVESKKQ